MNEQEGSTGQGAISGASTGASAGAAFGPWGAVIGGVIGAVAGGIGGFVSGGKKKKASRYMKLATQLQQQREAEAYKQNLLAQIRQARIARTSALASAVAAGSEEDSGAQGALSSYGAQTANIVEYLSVDRGRAINIANYTARAKKNLNTASSIDTMSNGIISLGAAITKAYGENRDKNKKPGEEQPVDTTVPSQPMTAQQHDAFYGKLNK